MNNKKKKAILAAICLFSANLSIVVSADGIRDKPRAAAGEFIRLRIPALAEPSAAPADPFLAEPDWIPFVTVEAKPMLSIKSGVSIYEDLSESARVVGALEQYGLCYLLKDLPDWSYVESGSVRGFVKKEMLRSQEEMQKNWDEVKKKRLGKPKRKIKYALSRKKTGKAVYSLTREELMPIPEEKIPNSFPLAREFILLRDNQAVSYTNTTTARTPLDKVYALARKQTVVREGKGAAEREVGILQTGGLCFILQEERDWTYVESGKVRGFLQTASLSQGAAITEVVKTKGEEFFQQAQELIPWTENKASYYILGSVK